MGLATAQVRVWQMVLKGSPVRLSSLLDRTSSARIASSHDDDCHVYAAQYQLPHTLYSLSSWQVMYMDVQYSLLHVGIHLLDDVTLCFMGSAQDGHLGLMGKGFLGYSVCMQPRQAAHQLIEAFFQAQPENSMPPCL